MKMRDYKEGDLEKVQEAIKLLQKARDLLKEARVVRTPARINWALCSARGAERHVGRLKFRAFLRATIRGRTAAT